MEHLWYVAYGSNLGLRRFRCYLRGGRPDGGSRDYPGCRDRRDPVDVVSLEVPGGLVFAGESGVWGGGMAFYDVHGPGAVACRAYLVTASQFADVAAQEMRHPPGGEFALGFAAALPAVEELHTMGPGRYETVLRLGEHGGFPLLTMTHEDASDLDLASPTGRYLRSIATGLREAHGWRDVQIAAYLAAVPGATGTWTRDDVAFAIGGPAAGAATIRAGK